jgi:hypothetical protein
MSENRARRKVFEPKGDKVTGDCGNLHTEKTHDIYSSQNIIRAIKLRRMRWAGHVARMREGEVHTRF